MAVVTCYGRRAFSHNEPCQCCGRIDSTFGDESAHKCASCIWHELYLPGQACTLGSAS